MTFRTCGLPDMKTALSILAIVAGALRGPAQTVENIPFLNAGLRSAVVVQSSGSVVVLSDNPQPAVVVQRFSPALLLLDVSPQPVFVPLQKPNPNNQ